MLGLESILAIGDSVSDGAGGGSSGDLGECILECDVLGIGLIGPATSILISGEGLRSPGDAAGNLKPCEIDILFVCEGAFGILPCPEGCLAGRTGSETSPCASESAGEVNPSGDGCAVERYPTVALLGQHVIVHSVPRTLTNLIVDYHWVCVPLPAYSLNASGLVLVSLRLQQHFALDHCIH